MKSILITGVSGFIGARAADYFKNKGWRVVGIDREQMPERLLAVVDQYEQLTLPDKAIAQVLAAEKLDYCLHCAGGASVGFSIEHPEEDFGSHVPATFGLLNALREHAPDCKVIYVSSAAVYGNPSSLPVKEGSPLAPISPYGYHKLTCELICREFHSIYDLNVALVRIFSAYGNGLRKQLLWDIYRKAKSSDALQLCGTGNETRDFIHISDIVGALDVIFAKSNFEAEVYNLASGEETPISKVSELVLANMNRDIPVIFDGNVRTGDPRNWRAEIERIKSLGFEASINLDSGIKAYVDWSDEQED